MRQIAHAIGSATRPSWCRCAWDRACPGNRHLALKMFEKMRDGLHNALLELEEREEEVALLEQRNAYLEGTLTLRERHHTNALKDDNPPGTH